MHSTQNHYRKWHPLLWLIAPFLCALPAQAQQFAGLGMPAGAVSSWAVDISEDGSTIIGDAGSLQSWRWRSGSGIELLGTLPEYTDRQFVGGLTADGSRIVGTAGRDADAARTGFLWRQDTGMARLPSGTSEILTAAAGDYVVGQGPTFGANAFRWSPQGGRESLGSIAPGPYIPQNQSSANALSSDGSFIVGTAIVIPSGLTTSVGTPYRWTPQTGMQPLLRLDGSALAGTANDVSADGSVITGYAILDGSGRSFFRWTEATGYQFFTALNSAGFGRISGDGSTIITGRTIWTEQGGVRSLMEVMTQAGCDFTGWSITAATGISFDARTICGEGIDPQGRRQAWVATIPAPGVAGVLWLGCVMAARRRTRVDERLR